MSSQLISVTSAATLTSNFRSQKESMLIDGMRGSGTLPVCETFSKSTLDIIFSNTNCVALRIYLGMDSYSKVRLILAGVNSSNEDIVISSTDASNDTGVDCVVENGARCPSTCPPSSSLNS